MRIRCPAYFAAATIAAFVALAAAPLAPAKEGVEATLRTIVPPGASAGQTVRMEWTLGFVDDQGKRRPFGAGGVFIRLRSAAGGTPTSAFAEKGRRGRYVADVAVPAGGVGRVAIGLRGITSGPDGTTAGDLFFPVRIDPAARAAEIVPGQVDPAQVVTAPKRERDGSFPAWAISAVSLTALVGLGALAVLLHRHRSAGRRHVAGAL